MTLFRPVASLLVGLALGWFLAPTTDVEAPPEVPKAEGGISEATRGAEPPRAADCGLLDALADRLEEQLDAARADCDEAFEDAGIDPPVAWPDDLDAWWAPGPLEAAVEEALDACLAEGVGWALDCAEPPCLLVFDAHDAGCTWEDLPDSRWFRNMEVFGPDGATERTVYAFGPDDLHRALGASAEGLGGREDARLQRVQEAMIEGLMAEAAAGLEEGR